MAYEFFLSYTRSNNDVYLKRFIRDLSKNVREKLGEPPTAEVGFFDQRDLELGEDWDNAIVEALQSSKVVIPVFSPAYFRSEYCGKELALFRDRCAASVPPGRPLPPLIKPIIWIPPKEREIPSALGIGQYTLGDPQAEHNTKGFQYVLKQIQKFRTKYNDLIEILGQQIIDAAAAHPIPRLAQVPSLKQVTSLFVSEAAQAPGASPVRLPSGPKHVRFVHVAAHPAEFGNARDPKPYLDSGGADWRPFFPGSSAQIHLFVQTVVSSELGFTSDELRFGPNLLEEIKWAWDQRQIVVLIVDGWSVHWGTEYRTVLGQLDQRIDYHWCVLVPENPDDPDPRVDRKAIAETIKLTFDRHANLVRNPMFYRDGIKSAAELKTALCEVLTGLKEEIRKRASVDVPVPPGPPRAAIKGPSN